MIQNSFYQCCGFNFRFCIVFTLFLMIIAYIRECTQNDGDIVQCYIDKQSENERIVVSDSNPHLNPPDVVMQCTKINESKKMFVYELIECFSLRKNIQILTSVKKPENAVPIVDGLKYILNVFISPLTKCLANIFKIFPNFPK